MKDSGILLASEGDFGANASGKAKHRGCDHAGPPAATGLDSGFRATRLYASGAPSAEEGGPRYFERPGSLPADSSNNATKAGHGGVGRSASVSAASARDSEESGTRSGFRSTGLPAAGAASPAEDRPGYFGCATNLPANGGAGCATVVRGAGDRRAAQADIAR